MSELTMKCTGKRIKELRELAGESQEQLAAAINAPNRETITRWENGSRDLKREHIIALSQHFNVSADYLLGLSDVKSVNKDIQTACRVTRLSEAAILNIQNITDHILSSKIADEITKGLDYFIKNLTSVVFWDIDCSCRVKAKQYALCNQILNKIFEDNKLNYSDFQLYEASKSMIQKDFNKVWKILDDYNIANILELLFEKYKNYIKYEHTINMDIDYYEYKINKSFSNLISNLFISYYENDNEISIFKSYCSELVKKENFNIDDFMIKATETLKEREQDADNNSKKE